MADRYCPSCGTEVDADARFCPTCGITLEQDEQPELPAAPSWPQLEPTQAGAERDPERGTETADMAAVPPSRAEDLSAPEQSAVPYRAPTPPPAPPVQPPRVEPAQPVPPAPPGESGADMPFTWPTTLSGWLIGIGSAIGALALIPNLFNAVSLLLFLALAGVAASVFLADRIPKVDRLRLWVLVVSMLGLGVALDRAAFGFVQAGSDSILLLAMLATAGGALLIELDRDRSMPLPGRPGG